MLLRVLSAINHQTPSSSPAPRPAAGSVAGGLSIELPRPIRRRRLGQHPHLRCLFLCRRSGATPDCTPPPASQPMSAKSWQTHGPPPTRHPSVLLQRSGRSRRTVRHPLPKDVEGYRHAPALALDTGSGTGSAKDIFASSSSAASTTLPISLPSLSLSPVIVLWLHLSPSNLPMTTLSLL